MRTILYTTERVSVESKDAYAFLLFLLMFAIAASYYVLQEGLADPLRNRYKLLLKCILILTSVVPPELPMELSLSVNYSILELVKRQLFCTEPFRIPFAGKVDVCCFDKTGTLTKSELEVKGIDTGCKMEVDTIEKVLRDRPDALFVLSGCHTLVTVEGEIVGDPLEKAAFESLQFKFDNKSDTSSSIKGDIRTMY